MAGLVRVPVTPAVLRWAVKESGFSANEVAAAADVDTAEFTLWLRGHAAPTLGQARALAGKLRRPLAAMLLPAPPDVTLPSVEFRRPSGGRKKLNPAERLRLREAGRLQTFLAWISEELGADPPQLRQFSTANDPERVASVARKQLMLTVESQLALTSSSAAWRTWRDMVEQLGVYVVVFPIGLESCRGFSIWNDRAPLIAINSSWSAEARSFTLLHEFAHLLTRTNSACLEVRARPDLQTDSVERWCERTAARILIPDDALETFVLNSSDHPAMDLGTVSRLAREFKTSRRAAAIRLIEAGYADWGLYRSIPAISELPRRGGGGAGRTRSQMQVDHYGARAIGDITRAVRRDVVTSGDVFDYLGLASIRSSGSLEPNDQF